MAAFALFLLVIFSICLYVNFCTKKELMKLPPGPCGFPVLGNLPHLGKRLHLKLHDWARTYGKMYTMYLGSLPVLVLNDKEIMKDLLGRMAATGKYQSELLTMTTWNGSYGLLTTEGRDWLEQKRFCLKLLRESGFGRVSVMEPRILDEADNLCDWMEKEQTLKGLVFLNGTINLAVGNVMLSMISGERSELEKHKLAQLSHDWVKFIQIGMQTGLAFMPWLKYIAPDKTGYSGLHNLCREFREHVENLFDQRKSSRRLGEPARGMIDAYIDKVETCTDPESTFYGDEGMKHVMSSVAMLMIAGTDGTGTTLHWLIFYLSIYPDAQKRLQEEIDTVTGIRTPSLSDKVAMPYLEAVVLETLRFASQTTLGGTVTLLENVAFHGYNLPKGMMVVSNLYHAHFDKNIWGDPKNFRPARFLEEGGEKLKEFVVAFHPGKRACPGEWLARDVLFLFVTKLFQKFTFSTDPNHVNVLEYLEPLPGFILYPQKLPVFCIKR